MPDDLAQRRTLRDDLRALKEKYPELVQPGAQRRLAEYLESEMEKEHRMPRQGDRMLGEDLSIVTFRIPSSALPLIDEHLLRMQQQSRWVRLGKSDAQRDIFLRGLDAIEQLPAPGRPAAAVAPEPEDAPQLPLVEPAATAAGGAIPTEPAPALPMEEDIEPSPRARRVTIPRDPEVEDMPLVPTAVAMDVAHDSAGAVAIASPPKRRKTAQPKAVATAKPTRTTRTTGPIKQKYQNRSSILLK